MPSIPRMVRHGIEAIVPPEIEEGHEEEPVRQIVQLFQKFTGVDLSQWQEIDSAQVERDYIEAELFVDKKIKRQIERELKGSTKGTKYAVETREGRSKVTDYEALKGQLMKHPAIGGNEQKALKVLASFHQGIGIEIQTHMVLEVLGRGANLFRLQNRKPVEKEVVRTMLLDLTQPDQIVFRFSEPYDLLKRDGFDPLVGFETHAEVVYQNGAEDKLHSQGFVRWAVTHA